MQSITKKLREAKALAEQIKSRTSPDTNEPTTFVLIDPDSLGGSDTKSEDKVFTDPQVPGTQFVLKSRATLDREHEAYLQAERERQAREAEAERERTRVQIDPESIPEHLREAPATPPISEPETDYNRLIDLVMTERGVDRDEAIRYLAQAEVSLQKERQATEPAPRTPKPKQARPSTLFQGTKRGRW